jgi:hypothetical protein
MQKPRKPIQMIFLKCMNWNTETCPHRNCVPVRLALLNPSPRVMLSEKTRRQLYDLCRTCERLKLP